MEPPVDRELLAYGLTEKFNNLRAYVVPRKHMRRSTETTHPTLEYHAKMSHPSCSSTLGSGDQR